MHIFVGILGLALALSVLWDAFETIILPRRVVRTFRIARIFYITLWSVWSAIVCWISRPKRRDAFLGYYGPLSLLLLFGFWAGVLILAFAMMDWAARSTVELNGLVGTFRSDLYLSGSTFFTLGLGDVTPRTTLGRIITVAESGTGFGFLAIIISYLPTLYGSFSQREVSISLLDARAGAPPTAGELMRRHGKQRIDDGLAAYLRDWETWSAQLMESHLTYPILCYFRSQHDNESWVAALAAILDVCTLLIAYGDGETKWQAQLTFAISRHAIADLTQIMRIRPEPFVPDRLPAEDLPKVRRLLMECGVPGCTENGDRKVRELRGLYEPYLNGLSKRLMMPVPSWGVDEDPNRDRPTTVWGRITSSGPDEPIVKIRDHHF